MILAALSIVVLCLLWCVLVSKRLSLAVRRTLYRTNLPFYWDVLDTWSRRRTGTRLYRASRQAKRRIARQLARQFVFG